MSEDSIPAFEDARSVALAAPLSPDPVGADLRATPRFEELEIEVRRIETEGPGAVRWDKVSRDALDLLNHQGRDLLVGAWLTYALLQTEGWRGFAVGLDGLHAMVADLWDSVPPKRERARVGVLEWLVGRATPVAAGLPVTETDIPALLHAASRLEDLNILVPEKLVKEQVALGELVRAVRPKAQEARDMLARAQEERARQAAQAEAEAQAAAAAEAQAAMPAPAAPETAPSSAPAALGSLLPSPTRAIAPPPPPSAPSGAVGADLERAVSALSDSMRQHAAQLRDADLSDPRSFRLARTASWLDITAPPDAKAGTTPLMPPSAQRRQGVEALRRAGEHEAVVRDLEGLIGSAPFWIDANRMSAEALLALGPAYAMAVEAVIDLTLAFIRRLPNLVELTFQDGTPFADSATRAWLEQHTPAAGPAGSDIASEGLADLAADVRDMVGAGHKTEALERLSSAHDSALGARARFDVHLLQVQTCLDLDLPAIALPLVQHLETEADRRELDGWEPGLALRCAGLALRAYRHPSAEKLLGDRALRSGIEGAQRRIARLDLRTAVRLVHA
ncbi:type VI secretion system protein TssA [Aquabacter cavernae]|uniref:type VI secretion system protein TssA n=1 Tax=Aquabacter cavernae TaxID=2496029 RepID=UPI000F8D6939|nr:type VI secretion system protein TssA [Aquabacter cavernae]